LVSGKNGGCRSCARAGRGSGVVSERGPKVTEKSPDRRRAWLWLFGLAFDLFALRSAWDWVQVVWSELNNAAPTWSGQASRAMTEAGPLLIAFWQMAYLWRTLGFSVFAPPRAEWASRRGLTGTPLAVRARFRWPCAETGLVLGPGSPVRVEIPDAIMDFPGHEGLDGVRASPRGHLPARLSLEGRRTPVRDSAQRLAGAHEADRSTGGADRR